VLARRPEDREQVGSRHEERLVGAFAAAERL
jgi:hypothetical protein